LSELEYECVILKQYADWEVVYLPSTIYMLGQGKYEAIMLTGGISWQNKTKHAYM
jgi:hypothetical protein